MFLSAFLASLAMLGPAAVAGQSSGPRECTEETANCIICRAKAFSQGFALSRDAFVSIGLNLAKYVCEGDESVNVAVEVEGIAFAVAEAVAVTSVECEASGQVEGSGMAIARAEASASATAMAIAEGFASIETCNGCQASVRVLSQATETAFVQAIAESSSEILAFVPERLSTSFEAMRDFTVDFAEKLIPVYAGIIADVSVVSTPPEETCTVTVAQCTEAGDEDACCVVTVDQAKEEIGVNAYASLEAIATLKDEACVEDADLSVTAVAAAEATGGAFAQSLSKIFGFCATTTDSDTCFWASGSIEAVAEAEAFALAEVTADVTSCNCNISVNAVAESYQEVLVSTITAVRADEVCLLGEGITIVKVIELAEEAASVEALAAIFVKAYSTCEVDICAATETKVNGASSSSFCCLETQPHVETYSEDAMATAIADAVVTTCTPPDEQPDLVARATASASALAEVSALAIAAFDVACGATDGYSYACGGGDVAVRAAATATAKAYAEGWAAADIGCGTGTCFVAVNTTTELVETIFVDAVASVWGEVCTSGGDSFDITFWKEKFAEEQLAVTAEAIAAAAWYQDNGTCAAVGVACATDDPNPAMSAGNCCSGVLSSFPDNPEAQNALASAEAEAFAGNYLCAPEAETESTAEQFVRAVATAFARAVTFVNADCTAPENGKACFIAESSITASAEAYATTVASAWALALNGDKGCGCVASADVLEDTTRTVLASATLEVLRNVCVDDGETYTESVFVDELVANHLTVFADAFATAKAGFDSDGEAQCTVFVDVDTGTVVPPAAAPLADDGEEIATAAIASDSETIEI